MVLETLLQDGRYALRTLRRTPAFAATAVVTLGVGLGLNTMLFTLFDAYVLRPLAVTQPYSLYQVSFTGRKGGTSNFTWEQYQQIRAQSPVFSDTLAADSFGTRVQDRSLEGMLVTDNYFSMLGVKMALGRPIVANDGPVAVLGYRMWQTVFAADPGVLGRRMAVNGRSLEVVGVCAPDFDGMPPQDTPPDFYVPLALRSALAPGTKLLAVVGRLRLGVTAARAQAAMSVLARQITADAPPGEQALQATLTSRATAVPLDGRILAVFSPLAAVFGLVLLICCANVANMMLARALARQREIGVRLSLGASRSRLMRQLLSENLLLAVLSGGTGLLVSGLGLGAAQRLLVSTLPKTYAGLVAMAPLAVDRRILFFLLLAATATSVAAGLVPALQTTSVNLVGALRGEFNWRLRSSRLRDGLVVSQVAVCLLFLVLTGVLLRNSADLQQTHVGYDTRGIVSPLIFGRGQDGSAAKLARYLSTQPWVEAVGAAMRAPLSGKVRVVPVAAGEGSRSVPAGYNMVSPEYFEMLRIPIARGRNFTVAESQAEAPTAIVSQLTANRLWPGEDALGKFLDVRPLEGGGTEQPRMGRTLVIGIAGDVVSGMVFQGVDASMVYFPTSLDSAHAPTLMVRGRTDSETARQLLEKALTAVVPDRASLAVALDDSFVLQVYPFRAGMAIAMLLGVVALLLTVSGMYGVMSYLVSQRSREIGIRMALGATPGRVIGLVLSQSGRLTAAGVFVGLILSVALAKLLSHVFFMLQFFDLTAAGVGLAVVVGAALGAAWFPSRRAARIAPMDSLRAE